MARKLFMTVVAALVATASFASQEEDSVNYKTVIDGLKVPLVESNHVAPTHFQDNWYIGVYGGAALNWGSNTEHAGVFKLVGPTAALTVGKEITPISGVRLQLNYTRNTGVTGNEFPEPYTDMKYNRYHWNSYGANIDYVLNFTNLVLGFRENRFFHLQGIIGLGGAMSSGYTSQKYADALGIKESDLAHEGKYWNKRRTLVNFHIGVAGTFMVARNWNLHVELMENLFDNAYDRNPETSNVLDGHHDLLVGVSYRFNNKGGIAPGFYYPRHDMTVYQKHLAKIEEIKDQARKRRQELDDQAITIDVDAQVMYTLIAFDENETTVDRLQQTNIYTTAYIWAKSPNSIIYITNSTGVDDKLFRKRADAIRNILLERYEIPASVIKVVPNEKDIKPIGDYVEFIVND
ncbi:MAG: hypothetical protein J1F40_00135 [Prevotellaceae bacterium]|nr:hypothetical protein [Prevotellaceae bacterium]